MFELETRQYQRVWEHGPADRAVPAARRPAAAEDFTQQPLGPEDGEEPGEADTCWTQGRQVRLRMDTAWFLSEVNYSSMFSSN